MAAILGPGGLSAFGEASEAQGLQAAGDVAQLETNRQIQNQRIGQQQTSSKVSGAASGAVSGAMAGSMFGPWGTVIGGVGGALVGALS